MLCDLVFCLLVQEDVEFGFCLTVDAYRSLLLLLALLIIIQFIFQTLFDRFCRLIYAVKRRLLLNVHIWALFNIEFHLVTL